MLANPLPLLGGGISYRFKTVSVFKSIIQIDGRCTIMALPFF